MDAAVAHNGLPRTRLSVRLPDPQHGRCVRDGPHGSVHRHGLGPPPHGNRRHARYTSLGLSVATFCESAPYKRG